MKSLRPCLRAAESLSSCPPAPICARQRRHLQTSNTKPATPVAHPLTPGPPPEVPKPQTSPDDERVARKKRNAELLERGRNLKTNPSKPGTALAKRFWKDVSVKESPDGYTVHLDARAVRTPTKTVLTIPLSKPHLATAIALEWDLLVSARQSLKHHYIPLTSLTARAHDIAAADAAATSSASGANPVRKAIVDMCMRYLTTDTLLCWAPEKNMHDPDEESKRRFIENTGVSPTTLPGSDVPKLSHRSGQSLRSAQESVARPIIQHLTAHIWRGVELRPALPDDSIMPVPQAEETQAVIRAWVQNLGAYDLAGLERAVLATKSLCVGARFVVEWSGSHDPARWTGEKGISADGGGEGSRLPRFTIEDAAEACSQEVRWQTGMWGEVEDTHDVENEDLRRQLGSVIVLVNGASA